MIRRIQKLHRSHSYFLFGARGTGKTTLLQQSLQAAKGTLWIDLLTERDEDYFGRHPDQLIAALESKQYCRVVVDEIQKAPKLLDIIHKCMETHKQVQFIMTGSSARKLKRGSANLLAARAFVYHLYPLTHRELLDKFSLRNILNFGSLPRIFEYNRQEDKNDFLRSYAHVYLREEIQMEQIVRKIDSFRDFLEIAAQVNGQIVNYSKISKQVGIDDKTVAQYFQILEDTLVGLTLPSYHRSIRKQQITSPKFYFFDLGIKRALERSLDSPLVARTFAFGQAFEHFIVLECHRLNEYFKTDYRFSYFKDKQGLEIDLIINRGRKKEIVVEIKSSTKIIDDDIKVLKKNSSSWKYPGEFQLWSCDREEKVLQGITCLPWQTALQRIWKEGK